DCFYCPHFLLCCKNRTDCLSLFLKSISPFISLSFPLGDKDRLQQWLVNIRQEQNKPFRSELFL
uniref:Uncharacterized protein n=1 Tax=Sinocyclocheilus anshuiensis TaxID=1608454 RepID=A0A671MM53_9TELE